MLIYGNHFSVIFWDRALRLPVAAGSGNHTGWGCFLERLPGPNKCQCHVKSYFFVITV